MIGVDQVPERLARVQAGGVEVIDLSQVDDVGDEVRALASCRRDPMPMGTLFDKQIQMRMGQPNVKR
ncbi:MAG TPA: hypothetical protein VFI99_15925 [Nocardioides sp.]|nr:hypothetical protein [Nocardioides sp.]